MNMKERVTEVAVRRTAMRREHVDQCMRNIGLAVEAGELEAARRWVRCVAIELDEMTADLDRVAAESD